MNFSKCLKNIKHYNREEIVKQYLMGKGFCDLWGGGIDKMINYVLSNCKLKGLMIHNLIYYLGFDWIYNRYYWSERENDWWCLPDSDSVIWKLQTALKEIKGDERWGWELTEEHIYERV